MLLCYWLPFVRDYMRIEYVMVPMDRQSIIMEPKGNQINAAPECNGCEEHLRLIAKEKRNPIWKEWPWGAPQYRISRSKHTCNIIPFYVFMETWLLWWPHMYFRQSKLWWFINYGTNSMFSDFGLVAWEISVLFNFKLNSVWRWFSASLLFLPYRVYNRQKTSAQGPLLNCHLVSAGRLARLSIASDYSWPK